MLNLRKWLPGLFLLSLSPIYGQEISYNGSFKLYQPGGTAVLLTGEYTDSVPSGTWTLYDYQGKIKEVHHYEGGMLQDTFYQYSRGKLIAKGTFRNNHRNGKWESYDLDNSILTNTEYYTNDTLNGWQKNRSHEILFVNGKAHGPYTGYAWNNVVRIRGNYVQNSREGVWVYKDQRIEVYTYEKNQRNGPAYHFTLDSVMIASYAYKQGKKEGLELVYRIESDGKNKRSALWESSFYVNGKKQGISVVYFPNGDTARIYNYADNGLLGWQLVYNAAGRLTEKRYWKKYDNTAESDTLYRWNDSGRLVEYEVRGRANNLVKRWGNDGMLLELDSSYTKNGLTMRDHYGYAGKTITAERHWLNNEMHGRWYSKDSYEYYYEKGKQVKVIKDAEDFYLLEMDAEDMMLVDAEGGYNEDDPIPDRLRNVFGSKGALAYTGDLPLRYSHLIGSRSQSLLESGIHGTVVLKVFVFRDGTPAGVHIVKSLNPQADAEALRVALDQYFTVGRQPGSFQPGWLEFVVEF